RRSGGARRAAAARVRGGRSLSRQADAGDASRGRRAHVRRPRARGRARPIRGAVSRRRGARRRRDSKGTFRMRAISAIAVCVLVLGCRTGEGEGEVTSERLFVKDCWNGPFDLEPTFFAAEPAAGDLMIRVQRGDNYEEVSDGL